MWQITIYCCHWNWISCACVCGRMGIFVASNADYSWPGNLLTQYKLNATLFSSKYVLGPSALSLCVLADHINQWVCRDCFSSKCFGIEQLIKLMNTAIFRESHYSTDCAKSLSSLGQMKMHAASATRDKGKYRDGGCTRHSAAAIAEAKTNTFERSTRCRAGWVHLALGGGHRQKRTHAILRNIAY